MKRVPPSFLPWLAIFAVTPLLSAQSAYLRIIDLLPITSNKSVDLYRGAEAYATGIKPGYFQNYVEVSSGTGRFSVRQNETVIGEFTLPASSKDFFTVAVYQDVGSPLKIAFYPDEIKKEDAKPGEPPPPPKKRLRLYIGGYDFPIKVTAQSLGEWTTLGKAQFLDLDVLGTPPSVVFVEYQDRYNQMIKVAYPTYLASGEASSVFITQRGAKRVNLESAIDNFSPHVAEDSPTQQGPPTP